ncbi:MAG: MetQ/NlpA family ABC transporter substrate-binding protein [Lachnospiraceae bacterium]
MKIKKIALVLIGIVLIVGITGCGKKQAHTITIGASATPHGEILQEAKKILEKQGWDLEITTFDDYNQPNLVVDSGEFDANYFQHQPYLDDFNQKHHTELVGIAKIHYEPFGLYPGTCKTLDGLKKGDVIGIPNDSTNEARALELLAANGILTIKKGRGLEATIRDIEKNPYEIEIKELEAAQLPRVREEMAMVVMNGNYALQASLTVEKDSIAYEKTDTDAADTFANIIAVKKGNEKKEGVVKLVEVLRGKEIQKFIQERYQGAVVFYRP